MASAMAPAVSTPVGPAPTTATFIDFCSVSLSAWSSRATSLEPSRVASVAE